MEFAGTTIGLVANNTKGSIKLVRVEFYKNETEFVLHPVSGHNLSDLPGTKTINIDEFENRPRDPYDKTVEARWALNLCGWEI